MLNDPVTIAGQPGKVKEPMFDQDSTAPKDIRSDYSDG